MYGNIGIAGLLDRLRVGTGVSHDQETGLGELLGDVIGKSTRGPATGVRSGSNVLGKLEDRTGTVGTLRDDHDILRVLHSDNDASSDHNLFPSLTQIEKMDTILSATEDVTFHAKVTIESTKMGAAHQHLLEILMLAVNHGFCGSDC